jgi:hypothetical protein
MFALLMGMVCPANNICEKASVKGIGCKKVVMISAASEVGWRRRSPRLQQCDRREDRAGGRDELDAANYTALIGAIVQ